MGYVAYTRRDVKDPATRPVMFAFNGGPGSSSLWLKGDLDTFIDSTVPPWRIAGYPG